MCLWNRAFAASLICAFTAIYAVDAMPKTAVGASADWPKHGADYEETGYSRLDQINTANLNRLGLAWALDLPGELYVQARPIAISGVLYFTGGYSKVYAVEAATGKLLWTYDPEGWKHNPAKLRYELPVNRGVAYADGRIFVCDHNGRLIALSAKTGKPVWSVETTPPESLYTNSAAPLAFDGKVVIGNSGADYGLRGYISAYDQKTGVELWRFYTTPGSPEQNKGDPVQEMAAKTWTGEYWKTGTGGNPWGSITYDPDLNRIYFGTGNASPNDPRQRSPGGGDNLFTVSIVALDAVTGKYVWHYQMNPSDAWEYDGTAQITLARVVIGGRSRKVLMQAPKNGFFYVLDRADGKLISAEKIGKVTWADRIDLKTGRPVEAPDVRYDNGESVLWPSSLGAHNWQDMSYDPKTGLVYIPYMQLGMRVTERKKGEVIFESVHEDSHDGKGAVLAWDPVMQKARWRDWLDSFWNGGVMTTAGGLVFQGTADGYLSAYDATSGKRLWHYDVGMAMVAAPISYSIGNQQYVSILTGYGGVGWHDVLNEGWKFGAQPRRLLTFRLDGRAVLPPSAPPDKSVHSLDDPSLKLSDTDVEAGAWLYLINCVACHGIAVKSNGPGPDLRESPTALDHRAFISVVHDGALLPQGMPGFENLSVQEVDQIYQYIRAQARVAEGPARGSD